MFDADSTEVCDDVEAHNTLLLARDRLEAQPHELPVLYKELRKPHLVCVCVCVKGEKIKYIIILDF